MQVLFLVETHVSVSQEVRSLILYTPVYYIGKGRKKTSEWITDQFIVVKRSADALEAQGRHGVV